MAMKDLWQRTTWLDRLVVLLLLGAALLGIAALRNLATGSWLVVEQEGKVVYRAPLSEERRITLPGPLGETVVEIKQGRVCVVDSPCPEKVCIGMGTIARSGEIVACVPNRLVLTIRGNDRSEGEHDLISR